MRLILADDLVAIPDGTIDRRLQAAQRIDDLAILIIVTTAHVGMHDEWAQGVALHPLV